MTIPVRLREDDVKGLTLSGWVRKIDETKPVRDRDEPLARFLFTELETASDDEEDRGEHQRNSE